MCFEHSSKSEALPKHISDAGALGGAPHLKWISHRPVKAYKKCILHIYSEMSTRLVNDWCSSEAATLRDALMCKPANNAPNLTVQWWCPVKDLQCTPGRSRRYSIHWISNPDISVSVCDLARSRKVRGDKLGFYPTRCDHEKPSSVILKFWVARRSRKRLSVESSTFEEWVDESAVGRCWIFAIQRIGNTNCVEHGCSNSSPA